MNLSPRVKIFGASALLAVAGAAFYASTRPAPREIRVYSIPVPWSSDPLELYINNNARVIGATRSGLVSLGERGEIKGILAENWETLDDFRVWKFKFREGMTYDNGEKIQPAQLVDSWMWAIARRDGRDARNEFLKDLEGLDQPGPDGKISGLALDGDSLTVRLTKPHPNLLTELGNPVLALTHPRCRNDPTGKWTCRGDAPSSGPYRIAHWDEHRVQLTLRSDFPASLRHPRAAESIVVGDKPEDKISADVIFGSFAENPDRDGFQFSGGAESSISFVLCVSWTHPASPCREKKFRRILRDRYLHFLREIKFEGDFEFRRSFFPPSIRGIEEAEIPPQEGLSPISGFTEILRVEQMGRPSKPPNAVKRAFVKTAASLGMTFVEVPRNFERAFSEMKPGLPQYDFDLIFLGFQLQLRDPEAAVRNAFQPGGTLPDESGLIRKELEKEKLDLNRVNSLIWEDALIWPLGHNTSGIWFRNQIDISRYNPEAGSQTLVWIGIK